MSMSTLKCLSWGFSINQFDLSMFDNHNKSFLAGESVFFLSYFIYPMDSY